MSDPASSCCAPSCCGGPRPATPADVHSAVRERYGAIARDGAAPAAATLGYASDLAAAAPEGADLGLGCGNPHAIAALVAGETVLDLGCGAGFDAILAARAVGPGGRVVGVDMTPDMLQRAARNVATAGLANVDLRQGYIESLPLGDATIDVVLSNCVVNLSPDKAAVYREAFRVLRPGGRLAISDIVTRVKLPDALAQDLALVGACVGGAATVDDTVAMLRAAGFVEVSVKPKVGSESMIRDWITASPELTATAEAYGGVDLASAAVLSAVIEARKP